MAKEIPTWLNEVKKRMSLIDVLYESFNSACNCKVCVELRKIATEYGDIFTSELGK